MKFQQQKSYTMNDSRREILRKVSALPALTFGLSGIASAVNCDGYAQWDPDTAYDGGTRVVYDDALWKAEWWTRGREPAATKSVWTKIGDCDGGDGGDGGSEELAAVINASNTTVEVGTEIEFDASESMGNIESYRWEIDGRTMTGETVTYTFETTGEFDIALTVTNADGVTASATETVSVIDQREGPTDEFKVVGYYPGWKATDDYNYYPEDIPWDKVTDVQYAFLGVDAARGVPTIMTDLDRQNLERFKELKSGPAADTRVKISVGGWADSTGFSDIAASEDLRQSFAKRSVEIVRQYDLDGVDIDWEHPGSQQGKCGCGRNADYVNQVKLLRDLRTELDTAGSEDGRKYWLSIANGGSDWNAGGLRHGKIGEIVDYAMIMAYDFTGSWMDSAGLNAPINGTPHDNTSEYGKSYTTQYTVDYAIKIWNEGPNGDAGYWPGQWKYPASDGTAISNLVLGLPFYGRGFNTTELYSSYSGLPKGTWHELLADGADPTGAFDFGDLEENYEGHDGWEKSYHPAGDVPYLVNQEENTIIGYDDEQSIEQKVQLAKDMGMQGVMFWELAQDWNETLLDTINATV
jgi:chitinase